MRLEMLEWLEMVDDPKHLDLGQEYKDYLEKDAPMVAAEFRAERAAREKAEKSLSQSEAREVVLQRALVEIKVIMGLSSVGRHLTDICVPIIERALEQSYVYKEESGNNTGRA